MCTHDPTFERSLLNHAVRMARELSDLVYEAQEDSGDDEALSSVQSLLNDFDSFIFEHYHLEVRYEDR